MTDAYDSLAQEKSPINFMTPENRKDLTYMQYSNSIIGSLAIIFSLVFVWNAVDIAITLFCGRKPQDSCYYDHLVKKELRSIVQPPLDAPTVPDEDFFNLIQRLQSGRLEDQRASLPKEH